MADTRDLIEQNFPYDGPHTPDTVTAAASCVDDLTRYLANATWPNKPVTEWAPDIYRVVGQLGNAVGHLPQVFRQLADAVDALRRDESMYDDRRSEAFQGRDTAMDAVYELRLAAHEADLLQVRLTQGGSQLSHLGHETDDEGRKLR